MPSSRAGLVVQPRTCKKSQWSGAAARLPKDGAGERAADIVVMFSLITHLPPVATRAYPCEAARVLKPGGTALVSFLDPAVGAHRKQIRPPIVEAIVTRIAWAPNVATAQGDLRAWVAQAGLAVQQIDSPSALGQSLAVLRKAPAG